MQNRAARMKSLLLLPSEDNIHDYYLYEDEWMNCLEKLAVGLLKKSVVEQEKEFIALMDVFIGIGREMIGADLSSWTDEQMLDWFERHSEVYEKFSYYAFTPWAVDIVLAPRLQAELEGLNDGKANEWFEAIAKPTRFNGMTEQRLALLSLAESGKVVDLSEQIEKYAWIPVYDLRDKPWEEKDFRRMLAEIKDPELEKKELVEQFELNKKKYQAAVKEIEPARKLKQLIDIVHWHLWLRDKRVGGWRQVLCNIMPFYVELAKRAKVSLGQVVNLFNEEIVSFLSSGKLPVEFEKRSSRHALYYHDGKSELFNDPEEIKKLRKEQLSSVSDSEKEIRGLKAYPGVVQGKARVIRSGKDLSLLEIGEVLVVHHTSPDYVIAMKKAAAFVTDEGGITSHAAVVSRELKIPCVTATTDGSKVIKTGDLVEVDADKGVVRIIKKADE